MAREPHLIETDHPADIPLIDAAEEFAAACAMHKAAGQEKESRHANLLSLMRERGQTVYHRGGILIVVEEKEKATVTIKREGDA